MPCGDKGIREQTRQLSSRRNRRSRMNSPPLPGDRLMSHLKGIAFQSTEVELQSLRERLRAMTDEELIKFGKVVRSSECAEGWPYA